MEFYETEVDGIPWNSMEFHERGIQSIDGILWNSVSTGLSWSHMTDSEFKC
jgi:hypothetical protein